MGSNVNNTRHSKFGGISFASSQSLYYYFPFKSRMTQRDERDREGEVEGERDKRK